MSTACGIVMQRIKKEEYLLCGLRKMYEDNKKVRREHNIQSLMAVYLLCMIVKELLPVNS